jgi:hypothetical protein
VKQELYDYGCSGLNSMGDVRAKKGKECFSRKIACNLGDDADADNFAIAMLESNNKDYSFNTCADINDQFSGQGWYKERHKENSMKTKG